MLFERLGESRVAAALRQFDAIYRQAGGVSPLAEVAERLAAALPGMSRRSISPAIAGCTI